MWERQPLPCKWPTWSDLRRHPHAVSSQRREARLNESETDADWQSWTRRGAGTGRGGKGTRTESTGRTFLHWQSTRDSCSLDCVYIYISRSQSRGWKMSLNNSQQLYLWYICTFPLLHSDRHVAQVGQSFLLFFFPIYHSLCVTKQAVDWAAFVTP